MEGYEVVGAIALGLLIDVAMAYVVWRWVLPMPTRRRGAVGTGKYPIFCDDADDDASSARFVRDASDDDTFERTHGVSGDEWFTHGHACNPATGLPMVDDAFDVAGNPYGTDFSEQFNHDCGDSGSDGFGSLFESFGASDSGSGFGSFGSDCFDSGLGGMHDW